MVVAAGVFAWLLLSGACVAGVIYGVTLLVNARRERDWALVILLTAISYPWQFLVGMVEGSVIGAAVRRMETDTHLTHTIGSIVLAWHRLLSPIEWLPMLIVVWLALRRHSPRDAIDP